MPGLSALSAFALYIPKLSALFAFAVLISKSSILSPSTLAVPVAMPRLSLLPYLNSAC